MKEQDNTDPTLPKTRVIKKEVSSSKNNAEVGTDKKAEVPTIPINERLESCCYDDAKEMNKTGINVKSLFHRLMKNPEMIPKVMGIDEEDDVSNLKLTRSKSKQFKHQDEYPSLSFEGDVAITRITRSFINIDYGQDDENDDDYKPEQPTDGSVEDDNEENVDEGDVMDDLEEELMKFKDSDEDGKISEDPEVSLMETDDSMVVRTRSRVKNREIVSFDSCNFEPENDVLLYSAVDDPDYMTFINTLNDPEASKFDLDDDDPEYDFMADEIEDETEKDEVKMNRETEIPIREVEDLLEDIFAPHVSTTQKYESSELPFADCKDNSLVVVTTSDQSALKNSKSRIPRFDDHIIALIDTTEEVLEQTCNSASLIGTSLSNPPHFTSFECSQLHAQLQKHVQLLTQFVVGCQFEPELQKERDAYQEMINCLHYSREKAASHRSMFNIPNLDACIVSCHDARHIDEINAVAFTVDKANMIRPQTMVVLSRSEAVLFPELVPDVRMQLTSSYYRYFSKEEERLLALGLYEFSHVPHCSYQQPNGRNSLISRHYLPTKTPTQIKNHMKNFRSSTQGISAYIARAEQGKVTLVFAPETCRNKQAGSPISWNSDLWPEWLKVYHSNIRDAMDLTVQVTDFQGPVKQFDFVSDRLCDISFLNTQLASDSSNCQSVNLPSTNTLVFVVQTPQTAMAIVPDGSAFPSVCSGTDNATSQFSDVFIPSNAHSSLGMNDPDIDSKFTDSDLNLSHSTQGISDVLESSSNEESNGCLSGSSREDVYFGKQSSTESSFVTPIDKQQKPNSPVPELFKESEIKDSHELRNNVCDQISILDAKGADLRKLEQNILCKDSMGSNTMRSPETQIESCSENPFGKLDEVEKLATSDRTVSNEDKKLEERSCNTITSLSVPSLRSKVSNVPRFFTGAAVLSDEEAVVIAGNELKPNKELFDGSDVSLLSSSIVDAVGQHTTPKASRSSSGTSETPLITPRVRDSSISTVDNEELSSIDFEPFYMGQTELQTEWNRDDFVPKTPRFYTPYKEDNSSNEGFSTYVQPKKGKKNLFGTSTDERKTASKNCELSVTNSHERPEFRVTNESHGNECAGDDDENNQPGCSKDKDEYRSSEDEKCRNNAKRGKKRKRLDRLVTGLKGMLDYSHRLRQFKALSKVILSDFKQQMFMHQDKIRSVQALINTEEPSPAMFEKLYGILAPEHTLLLLLLSLLFPESALPSSVLCSPSRKAFLLAIEMIMNIEAYTFFGKTKYSARSIFRCIRQLGQECNSTELENRLRELISNEEPLWFALSTNFPATKCSSSYLISDYEFLDLESLSTSQLEYEDVDLSVALGPGGKKRQLSTHISNGKLFIERNGKLCEAIAYRKSDDKKQTDSSAQALVLPSTKDFTFKKGVKITNMMNNFSNEFDSNSTLLEISRELNLSTGILSKKLLLERRDRYNVRIDDSFGSNDYERSFKRAEMPAVESGTKLKKSKTKSSKTSNESDFKKLNKKVDEFSGEVFAGEESNGDLVNSVARLPDANSADESSVLSWNSVKWTRFDDKTLLYTYNDCSGDFDNTVKMAAERLQITDTNALSRRLKYLLSWFK
uniref:GON-4-like protein n=1 Tax=Syphacia muris TaxID=451379 RepID=A0A0N5AAE7_9BILA